MRNKYLPRDEYTEESDLNDGSAHSLAISCYREVTAAKYKWGLKIWNERVSYEETGEITYDNY